MRIKSCIALIGIIAALAFAAKAQTTAFTYQGSLKDGASAANGNYDFEFALFDAVSGGNQLGSTLSRNTVAVANGIFAVSLDFGSQFPGAARFLQIHVRPVGGVSFTQLTPRQAISNAPYAIKSLNADAATNATQLGGIAPSGFIQNTASQQANSNFNITGNGTAGGTLFGNIVNAGVQYNIGGGRVLSIAGTDNLFAGTSAGQSNTMGGSNVFVGATAGQANTTGSGNSFIGASAGQANTTGGANLFVGTNAGFFNTTGFSNSFVGAGAGQSNTTGSDNSFFGFQAGAFNMAGSVNSFFGYQAGLHNTTGGENSFFGYKAGSSNTTGGENSFFGYQAGSLNTMGTQNSFFGINAGGLNTTGGSNAFVGFVAGGSNTTGGLNSFVGDDAGHNNTTGSDNSFVGAAAGFSNTTGGHNTAIGDFADVGSTNLSFATAIGAGSIVSSSNTIVLGRSDASDVVEVPGKLQIDTLGTAGSTSLCLNSSNRIGTCSSSLRYKTNIGAFGAGLSLIRRLRPIAFDWKEGGMRDIGFGAEEVAKIDPRFVTYNNKGEVEGVKYDRLSVAFVNAFAEQQAQIEAHQKQNQLQQTQIEAQRKQIEQQQKEIEQLKSRAAGMDALKRLVCLTNKQAEICKE